MVNIVFLPSRLYNGIVVSECWSLSIHRVFFFSAYSISYTFLLYISTVLVCLLKHIQTCTSIIIQCSHMRTHWLVRAYVILMHLQTCTFIHNHAKSMVLPVHLSYVWLKQLLCWCRKTTFLFAYYVTFPTHNLWLCRHGVAYMEYLIPTDTFGRVQQQRGLNTEVRCMVSFTDFVVQVPCTTKTWLVFTWWRGTKWKKKKVQQFLFFKSSNPLQSRLIPVYWIFSHLQMRFLGEKKNMHRWIQNLGFTGGRRVKKAEWLTILRGHFASYTGMIRLRGIA